MSGGGVFLSPTPLKRPLSTFPQSRVLLYWELSHRHYFCRLIVGPHISVLCHRKPRTACNFVSISRQKGFEMTIKFCHCQTKPLGRPASTEWGWGAPKMNGKWTVVETPSGSDQMVAWLAWAGPCPYSALSDFRFPAFGWKMPRSREYSFP